MKQYVPSKTAILVDGGYYRKRAIALWGKKDAETRASELIAYCSYHISEPEDPRDLYRIFYYDCPPMKKSIQHPLNGVIINYAEGEGTKWAEQFYKSLSTKIKVALRMGELAENNAAFALKPHVLTELLNKTKTIEELAKEDFFLDVKQKGVDMRIGLDAASISSRGFVNQIVLIAGDSDFLPVAKVIRRNGVDFILDPMKQSLRQSLYNHIDMIETYVDKMYTT